MTKLPQPRQKRRTVTDRVLATTSAQATELAQRWGTTKVELYRWLVELASGYDSPEQMLEALAQRLASR